MRKPDRVFLIAFAVMMLCVIIGIGRAQAQPTSFCASMADAEEALAGLGEVPVFAFMVITDSVVTPKVMFANPETGTWTLIAISPDGTACTTSSGGGLVRSEDALGLPQAGGNQEGI